MKGFSKVFGIFISLLLAMSLSACASDAPSGSEGPDYADDEVMASLAQGLENRFDTADAQDAAGAEVNAEYYANVINEELDQVLPYRDRQFEDSDLQEAVLSYANILEDSLELTETYPVDSIEFLDEWTALYNERTVLLQQFVNDYHLTVDEAHQDTLDELLVNANAVTQRTQTEDAVNALAGSITFEQQDDGYGSYTYIATAENTSGINFGSFGLVLALYDDDGVRVEETYASVSSWAAGETVRFEAYGTTGATQIKVSVDYYEVEE